MNDISNMLLGLISDFKLGIKGAFSIREDGECTARQSSANIKIESKTDLPGMDVYVKEGTKGETVFIPACVTHGNVDDLVYNDFHVADNCDIIIEAGCGVHTDDEEEARHNGVHRFFIGKNSRVLYKEKHIGTGDGKGLKKIDPVTDIELDEDAYLEMDTVQISGVDKSTRTTRAKLKERAKLIIRERIMTDGDESATTDFAVEMNGEDSGVDIISRSVAKGNSYQDYHSVIKGNCRCTGHSECDAILVGKGRVNAAPELYAGDIDASLIHEAAIGKIAGEQITKLRTLGLTEEEAEAKIIEGFLKA